MLVVRFLVDGCSFSARGRREKGTSPATKAVREFAVEGRRDTPIPNPVQPIGHDYGF